LEVSDVSLQVENTSKLDVQSTKLRISTSESAEQIPKKEAKVSGNTVTWEMDQVRMPVYDRYQSSVVFEIGKADGLLSTLNIKKIPEAITVLWLQDLTDDIEQEVKLPVLAGPNLQNLRQNVINDFTKEHHEFEVVGWITARMKLDSGLDEDHEVRQAIFGLLINVEPEPGLQPPSRLGGVRPH
jgi:hypothetical protein